MGLGVVWSMFMWSVNKGRRSGFFHHSKSSPAAFERASSLESRCSFSSS